MSVGVDETGKLLPTERAKYYRALSADALQRAKTSNDQKTQATYISMAMGWTRMAAMCERDPGEPPTLPPQAAASGQPGLSPRDGRS